MSNLFAGIFALLLLSSSALARTEPAIKTLPGATNSVIDELNEGVRIPAPIEWLIAPESFYASGRIIIVPLLDNERENYERLSPQFAVEVAPKRERDWRFGYGMAIYQQRLVQEHHLKQGDKMKIWNAPQVREQAVGLEVTSYLPAEIDVN